MSMDAGLVGHWKFNEKSGIVANDSSRYRNTGTLTGATHLPVWADKGIKFDGVDDYVDAGNNASLNIIGDISISAYIYPIDVTLISTICSKSGGTVTSNQYNLRHSATSVHFIISDGATQTAIYSNILRNNTWFHIVGTLTGSTLRVYVNGVLGETQGTINVQSTTVENVSIGTRKPSLPGNFFKGQIDEVRIYNRALSASEIKRQYESTKHKYI